MLSLCLADTKTSRVNLVLRTAPPCSDRRLRSPRLDSTNGSGRRRPHTYKPHSCPTAADDRQQAVAVLVEHPQRHRLLSFGGTPSLCSPCNNPAIQPTKNCSDISNAKQCDYHRPPHVLAVVVSWLTDRKSPVPGEPRNASPQTLVPRAKPAHTTDPSANIAREGGSSLILLPVLTATKNASYSL